MAAQERSRSSSQLNLVIASRFAIRSQRMAMSSKASFPRSKPSPPMCIAKILRRWLAFDSTTSVSLNGPIAGQDLPGSHNSCGHGPRGAGRGEGDDARRTEEPAAAEKAAALADAQVVAAKRALILANRLTGLAKDDGRRRCAGQAGASGGCRRRSTGGAGGGTHQRNPGAGGSTERAERPRRRAGSAAGRQSAAMAQREREGKAARALKKKFFATMPVRASHILH